MSAEEAKSEIKVEEGDSALPSSLRACAISDVCKATGLGRTSIYAAIAAGELPARKWKRRTIVLAGDLEEFLRRLPTMPRAIREIV
jgi:Helix-turn-helix domain